MSAIAGIVYRDSRPALEIASQIARMLDVMPHRGSTRATWPSPDAPPTRAGSGQLTRSAAANARSLDNTSLNNTTLNNTTQRVLVCDARLDNRDELRAQLGLEARDSDATLLLRAYERWNAECVDYLLGEWAFAVWDAQRQQLFAARDPFATRSFYFHVGPRFFAFATEIKALLALPDVPHAPNELRIAEHLTSTFGDATNTFYHGIARLAPAHLLECDGSAPRIRRFYQLDINRDLPLQSDADYASGLREVLTLAVRDRMRDHNQPQNGAGVASLLSGGLDSSAVSCVARDLLRDGSRNGHGDALPVFSGVFPDVPECDETPFINAVLQTGGFAPHNVRGDLQRPVSNLPAQLRAMDEPFFAPGFSLVWALLGAVRESGARVLLDGHGGDEAISLGDGILAELARAGNWRELWARCRGISRIYGDPALPGWLMYTRAFAPISPSRALHVRAMRAAVRVQNRLPRRSAPRDSHAPGVAALLSPELAARVNFDEYKRELAAARVPGSFGRAQTERATHFAILTDPLQAYATENSGRAAAHFGLDLALPFWDKRVIEYCLALPGEQKTSPRWTRDILRRAMHNILPPEVQWRTTKNDFLPNFLRGLRTDSELLDNLMNQLDIAAPYLNTSIARQAWIDVRDGKLQGAALAGAVMNVWSSAQIAFWLREL